MSRRRKHGYSPGPKDSPRRTAAAEVCSSAAEPGRRRLRSTRCPGLRGVEERHPQPVLQQEQRPTVASCSKSNSEEKYGTPKRMLKMDILPSSFSSPNDPDGLNDIFWDQNSPMTKHLDKGRKTHINTTDRDEISHIVNRIAPQDEKPIANSMLGMWIGETAIPCTPNVAKGKSRAKICYTKLKTHNQEEELMKLAKQFDKNMEELDVIQEQKYRIHDCTQKISGTKTLNDCNDNIQKQSLCNLVPEINTAVIKKLMKENTKIPLESDLSSSHRSFDQNVEAAFNAIFDDSTQKCSGQLSQDLSDGFLNASNNSFGKKSGEEKIVTSETLITVKQNQNPGSFSSQIHTPINTKSCVTSHAKETETLNKPIDPFATSDFQEDWENLLRNEPFMMPELPKLKTSHGAVPKGSYTFNRKNNQNQLETNTHLAVQDLSSKTCNTELMHAAKHKYLPDPNDEQSQLSAENKMKYEKSFNEVIQNQGQDCVLASYVTKIKEDVHIKLPPTVDTSEKTSSLDTRYVHDQENQPIFNQSIKTDAFGSATSASERKSDRKTSQTNAPNLVPFLDDWNDPSFASEIIKACHQVENTWETDDLDDDLLYQVCDDVERLTQQHDAESESKASESRAEISGNAKNKLTLSKRGSCLVQSKHLNLGNIAVQASPLTNITQIDKLMKVQKRETCSISSGIESARTNTTVNSKNSNDKISNLHVSCNNTDVPMNWNKSELVLGGSSSLNMSSGHRNIGNPDASKLNAQHLSQRPVKETACPEHHKTVKFSKYTFTKTKNFKTCLELNKNHTTESMSDTELIQSLEGNEFLSVNSLFEEKVAQKQSPTKLSECLKQPSKEEEEKNRKYSPEEIQRKRQEALVRRMARAQTSSLNAAPT